MPELPYIKSEAIAENFKAHLDDEYNERILFSAGFGAGKSTFLKRFFESHPEYIVLKLYPVNYSVAQNQDVFELIKYDLLYELLSNFPDDINLDQEQFTTLLIAQMFILHQMKIDVPLKILMKAADLVMGTGIVADKTADSVIELINSFSDFKKGADTNEYKLLNKYIRSFKDKPGHAHESDAITELLVELLDRVKTAKAGEDADKKVSTVLLIDDLDRLDPEHVFRLFNVFSAHYDDVTETNKFGFDKVVFVCDADNIQQMFHHRYGLNVEFSGYIDKYYSTEIFRFDFVSYLKNSTEELILSRNELMKYFEPGTLDKSFIDQYDLKKHDGFFDSMKYILFDMIDEDILRIRSFNRFKYFAIPRTKIKINKHQELHVLFYPFLMLMMHIGRFFPRPVDLQQALQKLCDRYDSNYDQITAEVKEIHDFIGDELIQWALQFLVEEKQAFGFRVDTKTQYSLAYETETGEKLFVVYSLYQNMMFDYVWVKYAKCVKSDKKDDDGNFGPALRRPNPYWFVLQAYTACIQKRFL